MKNYFRDSSPEQSLGRNGLNSEEGGNKLLWKFGNYLSVINENLKIPQLFGVYLNLYVMTMWSR